MVVRTRKKEVLADVSCLDAARERIHAAYDRFDRVVVSFSGGKDSSVCLELALEEARRRKRLPLDAHFYDEEAISPDTEAYVRRVYERSDVNLRWLCLPVEHRNGCSATSPKWWPWDPKCPELWTRPMPSFGEATIAGFELGMSTLELNHLVWPGKGSLGVILGIRADESMRRYQGIAAKAVDAWITKRDRDSLLKPIYDWTTDDVWLAPHRFGWDFNSTYTLMERLGIPRSQQRVAPPYGEQPMQMLSMWAELWPSIWGKMSLRVPGAATGARLSRTAAYGFGGAFAKPEEGWKAWTARRLEGYSPEHRIRLKKKVEAAVAQHASMTREPLPDDTPHRLSGLCWKRIARVVLRGDFKNREQIWKGTEAAKKFAKLRH